MQYIFSFTTEEVNVVTAALKEIPWKFAQPLFEKMTKQYNDQVSENAKAVRSDQGQTSGEGSAAQEGANSGGENLQQ